MVDVECWLFWGTMMPVRIRTGSLKLYRRRGSRFYGTAPFRLSSQLQIRLRSSTSSSPAKPKSFATKPVVLLAHEPDIANAVSHYPVDLQLSGHSKSGFCSRRAW